MNPHVPLSEMLLVMGLYVLLLGAGCAWTLLLGLCFSVKTQKDHNNKKSICKYIKMNFTVLKHLSPADLYSAHVNATLGILLWTKLAFLVHC